MMEQRQDETAQHIWLLNKLKRCPPEAFQSVMDRDRSAEGVLLGENKEEIDSLMIIKGGGKGRRERRRLREEVEKQRKDITQLKISRASCFNFSLKEFHEFWTGSVFFFFICSKSFLKNKNSESSAPTRHFIRSPHSCFLGGYTLTPHSLST